MSGAKLGWKAHTTEKSQKPAPQGAIREGRGVSALGERRYERLPDINLWQTAGILEVHQLLFHFQNTAHARA
jgi:hypothetical protein